MHHTWTNIVIIANNDNNNNNNNDIYLTGVLHRNYRLCFFFFSFGFGKRNKFVTNYTRVSTRGLEAENPTHISEERCINNEMSNHSD